MKLILIRHGETEENKKRIIHSGHGGNLSELGIMQAESVALRLKEENIDLILSSDLLRASDTAKEIAKFHEVSLNFLEDLRERNAGKLEGKTKPENWDELKWNDEFARKFDMETSYELHERAKKFVNNLLKNNFGKTVVLVFHNGINQAMINFLLGNSHEKITELSNIKNGSVTIFEFDENKNPELKILNSTEHLEPVLEIKNVL